jgi:hypothetical protein
MFNFKSKEMKKIYGTLLIGLFAFGLSQAQVAIGKDNVSSASVSLDFDDSEPRGLLLPWVTDASTLATAVNGTMVFDRTDNKVKVKYAGGWEDLSVDPSGDLNGATQPITENPDAKVRIGGDDTDTTPGILVLADTNKAMVLPKVADTDDIINPAPGMMVYVTSKQLLAVFNGTVWSFWKVEN